jgi:hypothetical protein
MALSIIPTTFATNASAIFANAVTDPITGATLEYRLDPTQLPKQPVLFYQNYNTVAHISFPPPNLRQQNKHVPPMPHSRNQLPHLSVLPQNKNVPRPPLCVHNFPGLHPNPTISHESTGKWNLPQTIASSIHLFPHNIRKCYDKQTHLGWNTATFGLMDTS